MLQLYFAATSPYVRKVMVVAHHLGVADRIEHLAAAANPVNRDRNIAAFNPLAKVPAARTDDGLCLFDSRVICEYIDSERGGGLFPAAGRARWIALTQQALADGLLDAAILVRYERTLRPAELRWAQWDAGQMSKIDDCLNEIEAQATVLALAEAKEKGVINAQECAAAVALVKQRLDEAKAASNGFFGGFAAGARSALQRWTDFAAAGREAAATLVDGGLNGLTDAFADIITGTKSAKEAFKDFARQMLADLARMIAKLFIMRTLQAAFGMEDGGVVPAMEKGGIRAFAAGGVNRNGGIARRPTVLFGEGKTAEAFVPLPDNRSIPVSFVGGGPSGGNVINFVIHAMDSRDVQRALYEQQGTLRTIFTNQAETQHGMRQVIRRAAG